MSRQAGKEIIIEEMEPIALSDRPEFESADLPVTIGGDAGKKSFLISTWERMKKIVMDIQRNLFSDVSTKRTRVYQTWPGNNVFFFRGRFICGPDPRGLVLTAVSIGISSWIFCMYVAQDLPEHSNRIIIFSVILTLAVLLNLVVVSTIDPGILPRNGQPPNEQVGTSKRPRMKTIIVNGIEVKSKYCRICKIYRPPRSCHCAICDNCVEKFDHHCPWIGQCIGSRNYRFYLTFLIVGFVFFLYVFAYCFSKIHERVFKDGVGLLRLLKISPETVALALFSFGAIWFTGCLASYHVYLIAINQTFYENFRSVYAGSQSPYDKGILGNLKEALFSTLPPSRVDFRAEITAKELESCHNQC